MHAGSVNGVDDEGVGSQDTNTLILIHVYAGGKQAVGFSISRDDLVTYPQAYDGQTEGKIDGAYAYAYTQYISENYGKESNSDLYLHANQAGQAATIATVQAVTGQHIDHFVEVNLAGFYSLAAAFGGIEVCIQPAPASVEPDGFGTGGNLVDLPYPGAPFSDSNSGWNAYLDGYKQGQGRRAVPAPGPGPVAGVRPGAGHAARHRPRAHQAAAGGPRLRDLRAQARGRCSATSAS